jgi:hypothetical protein
VVEFEPEKEINRDGQDRPDEEERINDEWETASLSFSIPHSSFCIAFYPVYPVHPV